MATENDKANETETAGGSVEVSGKTWRAYVPVALVVGLLSNSGSFAGCSKQDEVIRKLETIEKKVDRQNEKIGGIDVRVARIEGARGAGPQ